MPDSLNELIKYRIEQAFKTTSEVEVLIDKEFFVIAINRIYYGMFYMLLALALKESFKTSKHHQLLGWFNKEFVKPQKVSRETGKIIHRAFEDRTDGDYGVFVEFKKDEVKSKFRDMKLFISELNELITKDL
jgi:uncharacterized protein (UPF0332 family)